MSTWRQPRGGTRHRRPDRGRALGRPHVELHHRAIGVQERGADLVVAGQRRRVGAGPRRDRSVRRSRSTAVTRQRSRRRSRGPSRIAVVGRCRRRRRHPSPSPSAARRLGRGAGRGSRPRTILAAGPRHRQIIEAVPHELVDAQERVQGRQRIVRVWRADRWTDRRRCGTPHDRRTRRPLGCGSLRSPSCRTGAWWSRERRSPLSRWARRRPSRGCRRRARPRWSAADP